MRRLGLPIFGVLLLTGCGSSVTETGYEPHRLGMSDGQRRALYAPKYSRSRLRRRRSGIRTPSASRARGWVLHINLNDAARVLLAMSYVVFERFLNLPFLWNNAIQRA